MRKNVTTGWWRRTARLLFSLSAAWLVCGTAWAGTLPGTAMYRERIALPPAAVFEVELQDVSKADAPALVLGRARLDPAGSSPFRFEIAYDDSAVQAGHRYTVRANIKLHEKLLFTTDRHYPVLNGGDKPLQYVSLHGRRRQHLFVRRWPAFAGGAGGRLAAFLRRTGTGRALPHRRQPPRTTGCP